MRSSQLVIWSLLRRMLAYDASAVLDHPRLVLRDRSVLRTGPPSAHRVWGRVGWRATTMAVARRGEGAAAVDGMTMGQVRVSRGGQSRRYVAGSDKEREHDKSDPASSVAMVSVASSLHPSRLGTAPATIHGTCSTASGPRARPSPRPTFLRALLPRSPTPPTSRPTPVGSSPRAPSCSSRSETAAEMIGTGTAFTLPAFLLPPPLSVGPCVHCSRALYIHCFFI